MAAILSPVRRRGLSLSLSTLGVLILGLPGVFPQGGSTAPAPPASPAPEQVSADDHSLLTDIVKAG